MNILQNISDKAFLPINNTLKKALNYYKNLPVLVTGGAGFIGSHLVEQLVNLGAKVTIFDDLSYGSLENLDAVWHKITFIKDSITNFDACLKAAAGNKIIFHLAAITSVPIAQEYPQDCYDININGLINILESAKINKVQNFVFSSSSAVYGNQEIACSELSLCYPNSYYGISKFIGEIICKQYFCSLNIAILRYFNVYGSRQLSSAVLAKFGYCLKNNLPITVFGDGTQTRDFIDVMAVVQANLLIGAKIKKLNNELNNEIFNIASGRSLTILELINNLVKNFPEYNQEIIFNPERIGDIKHSQANCKKYYNFLSQFLD